MSLMNQRRCLRNCALVEEAEIFNDIRNKLAIRSIFTCSKWLLWKLSTFSITSKDIFLFLSRFYNIHKLL